MTIFQPQHNETKPETKFRVLSIDDQRDVLDLITICLHSQYEVIGLQDPAKALGVYEVFEPDVVILDIMMPKITGYQLIEQIKAIPDSKNVKVMFLSAKDSQLDQKYGYKLGVDVYMPKPFQPDRLLKNLEMMLQGLTPRVKRHTLRDAIARIQATEHIGHGVQHPNQQHSSTVGNVTEVSEVSTSQVRLKRLLNREIQNESREKKGWLG